MSSPPDVEGRGVSVNGNAGGRRIARPPFPADREAREQGSATVLGLGAILLLLAVLAGFLLVGAAVHGSLRARAAADAAALAGAAVLLESGHTEAACDAADELATANGATLTTCGRGGEVAAATAVIRVEVAVEVPALGGALARAVSRAGAVADGWEG